MGHGYLLNISSRVCMGMVLTHTQEVPELEAKPRLVAALEYSGTPLFWIPLGTVLSVLIKGGILISGVVCTLFLCCWDHAHSVLIKGDVLISGPGVSL